MDTKADLLKSSITPPETSFLIIRIDGGQAGSVYEDAADIHGGQADSIYEDTIGGDGASSETTTVLGVLIAGSTPPNVGRN